MWSHRWLPVGEGLEVSRIPHGIGIHDVFVRRTLPTTNSSALLGLGLAYYGFRRATHGRSQAHGAALPSEAALGTGLGPRLGPGAMVSAPAGGGPAWSVRLRGTFGSHGPAAAARRPGPGRPNGQAAIQSQQNAAGPQAQCLRRGLEPKWPVAPQTVDRGCEARGPAPPSSAGPSCMKDRLVSGLRTTGLGRRPRG